MILENIDKYILSDTVWTEVSIDWIANYGKEFEPDVEYCYAITDNGEMIILARLI